MKRAGLGVLAALLLATPGWAQDRFEEIVVTATRAERTDSGGEVPGVYVARRADNLLMEITVVCDTRDAGRRLEEMRQTLRNLIRGQRAPVIALGVGEGRVGVFDEAAIDDVIDTGARPDTSAATLLVKTRIDPGDSVDDAVKRIREYVARTAKVGRTEVVVDDEIQLSIINLPQYRPQVLAAVAADAKALAASLGEGYGVTLDGLESPVDWRQTGPLEARLFIPYQMTVQPVGD